MYTINMEYGLLISKLLRDLRGDRSQLKLSDELGYSYNQFAKWETNQRKIRWKEFVSLCEKSDVSLEKTICFCLKFVLRKFNQSSAAEFMQQFLVIHGFHDLNIIARRMRVHTSTIKRWLDGEVDPSLETMFQLMDLAPNFLELFLKRLSEKNPGFDPLSEAESFEETQLKYLTQFPWSLTLIAAFELEKFRSFKVSQLQELHELLSIDKLLIVKTLDDLVTLKILNKTDDGHQLIKNRFEFGNLNIKDILNPILYWTEKIALRMEDKITSTEAKTFPGMVYFSDYRVMAVTKEARDEMNVLIADFVGRMVKIFDSQVGPKDSVSCLVLHHFDSGLLSSDFQFENQWMEQHPDLILWSERLKKIRNQ